LRISHLHDRCLTYQDRLGHAPSCFAFSLFFR
jgi:hypothetical protein